MEREILSELADALRGTGLPDPFDGRELLVSNPEAPPWKTRSPEDLLGMVWHQELGWGSVEAVARYHTGEDSHLREGGAPSIAYTFAIRRDGQIVLCNDLERAPWSQGFRGRPGDENAEFVSVMLEGFFRGPGVTDPTAGEPNDPQLLSAFTLWQIAHARWGWQGDDLHGHYHFGKPSCPGHTLQAVIEAVRENAPDPDLDLSTVDGRQEALRALGFYRGEVDGLWGPRSRGALIRFQDSVGLPADGVWGTETEAAVEEALETE